MWSMFGYPHDQLIILPQARGTAARNRMSENFNYLAGNERITFRYETNTQT